MIKSKIVKILSTAALSIPILFAASALTKSNVSADSNKSPLVDVEIPAHVDNHHGKRNHIIDRITVHHAAGHSTAKSMGDKFAKPETDACSNYGIGYDGEVGLYLTEDYAAGCSYNDFNDHRSINIEVANASDFSAANDYKISDKAYNKLIELCEDICWRHGKDKLLWLGGSYGRTFDESIKSGSRAVGTPTKRAANGKIVEWKGAYEPKANEMLLTVHQWFTQTECPGRDLYNKLPGLAEEVTKRLQNRKKQQKQPTTTNTVSITATQVSTSTAVQQTDEIDYDIMSPYWNEKNVNEEELKEVANKMVKAYECMYGKKSGESYDDIVNRATICAEESCKEGVNPWIAWGQISGKGDTTRESIRAHIQHLVAYASTKDLSTPCVDPRFKYVARGSAKTVNALTGKWATDPNYGRKLNKLITELYESATTNTVSTTATQVSTSTAVQQTDEIDYDIMSPYWNEKNVNEEELKEVANKLVKAYECIYGKKSGKSYDDIVNLATIYAEETRKEGVNPWVAWGQMLLETGGLSFKGEVSYEQMNFCGLRTADGKGYQSFDTFREGIRAHIQHLVAYASTKNLSTPCVDPRFKYVARGSARTVNALTGKWATDPNYGKKLNKLITELYNSAVS